MKVTFLVIPLLLASYSAHADPLSDADARAAAYRATQPKEMVDGYTPSMHPGGLAASVPYEQEVIGDGVDLVSGAPRALCLLPGAMDVLSVSKRVPDSHLAVVQNDYDLQTFFSSVTDVTGSVNAGSFAASTHVSVGIARSLDLSVHDLGVIAHYTYTLGTRSYSGTYTLDPAYDTLRRSDPATFLARCGHGFLQAADNGAAVTVVYRLHQRHEVTASMDDVKATLSARYGLAEGSATETLTDQQKEILSSYDVTSDCYASGGHIDTCGLIRTASQVDKVWHSLVDGFTDQDAVALRTGYMTYSQAFGDAHLDITDERIRLQKLWEERRGWINSICNGAPYIPECGDARARVDQVEALIDDPHTTNIPDPTWVDGLPVFIEADLGHAVLFADVNGGGQKLDLHFSLNPKDVQAYRPDVVYMLKNVNFANMVSSAATNLEVPAHWVFELYANEDGTGLSWDLGQTNGVPYNVPRGHSCGPFGWSTCDDFNDQAKSFRLRYVP